MEIEPAAQRPPTRGRGARVNPTGRFERRRIEADLSDAREVSWADSAATRPAPDISPETDPEQTQTTPGSTAPATLTIPDLSRSALSSNQSPDTPFEVTLNPYRGCEHGCAYCYARPTHEYLGYSAGLDFETRILVKENAPALLRRELAAPRWRPKVVGLSGVTDAYQPLEKKLQLTRRCLEVFLDFRNPVSIVTKNALVARDLDLLRGLHDFEAVSVSISLTTLDSRLVRVLEPRASAPHERLRATERLANAGLPVGVNIAPIIPGLTDAELPALLASAASAGAQFASYIVLRLPHGLRELFDDWLLTHRPLRREKVLRRLESVRGGKLNDPRFGTRMRGEGLFAEQIGGLFALMAKRHGLDRAAPGLSTAHFRRPGGQQLDLAL
jgi:DNA repair photolyase